MKHIEINERIYYATNNVCKPYYLSVVVDGEIFGLIDRLLWNYVLNVINNNITQNVLEQA